MRDSNRRGVAVGFFDGVHLGHRAILDRADRAVTFSIHPLAVLKPEIAPRMIMTTAERVATIGKPVTLLDFTAELAAKSPAEFLALADINRDDTVYCGENWRFGRDGEGDAKWLAERGYSVEVVPYAKYRDEIISSSRIRKALAVGEIEDVNAMLGRRYSIVAARSSGKGLGRTIGYPTINFETDAPLATGVYEVAVDGVRGVANFGFAPTMGDRAWTKPTLEVHLLEAGEVTVGRVEFVRFLRAERKFASVEELRRQIAADCDRILAR